MFVDTTRLAENRELEFDVCVVGSGPAGLAVALGLRGSGLRVGILESGGLQPDSPTLDLHEGTSSGLPTWPLTAFRSRQFGGTSALWAGWCKPFRAEDFEARGWMPHSGWPIRLSDVEPHYAAARRLLDLSDLPFDAAAIAAIDGIEPAVRDTERLRNEVFQYSPPTRLGTKLLGDIDVDPETTVYLWANLTEIVLEPGLDRVDHLVVRTLSGRTVRARAGAYVLAAGGIENARLLLASSAQLPEGVGNSSGYVGRCLTDHPHCYSTIGWVLPHAIDLSFYQRRAIEEPPADVRGVLALSPEVRAEEQLLAFTAEVVPVDPASTDPASTDTGPLSAAKIARFVSPARSGEQLMRLTLRMEQAPDPDSRITLDPDRRDALGMPRVNLHWSIRDDDRYRMQRALAIVGAELAAQGLGRLWTPIDDAGALAAKTETGPHHMGTTRMSADPAQGVVDGNCRAHDVTNLYVVGASVFPTGSDSNPTLTVVAMADRLARHLREERP